MEIFFSLYIIYRSQNIGLLTCHKSQVYKQKKYQELQTDCYSFLLFQKKHIFFENVDIHLT